MQHHMYSSHMLPYCESTPASSLCIHILQSPELEFDKHTLIECALDMSALSLSL